MRRMYLTAGLAVFAALSWLLGSDSAQAHEPVFSPGPHTIYKGGVATSVSSTFDDSGGPMGFNGGLVYGLTADLNLAAGVPVVAGREADHGPSVAVGDPVVQVKWRPWKKLVPRRIDSLSLIGGVKVPAGHHDVSAGNTGYTFGVTAAREHQRYYLFGSARYTTQSVGVDGTKPGDVFQYDLVTGVRPFVLEYDQPDAVVLVELNGTTTRPPQSANGHGSEGGAEQHTETLRRGLNGDGEYRTRRQAHSGGPAQFLGAQAAGTELAATPELLLSWGPVMLKGGVQFPFFDTFDDEAATPTYRVKTDLIVQF